MKRIFLLTWRYMAFNKLKSTILVLCIAATLFMPIALQLMINRYEQVMMVRAEQTPLIVGTKGNRFDLTLKSLYFIAETPESICMTDLDEIRATGFARAIPLHLDFSARRFPLVGTTLDYFEFRQLTLHAGTLPLRLGDAVLGAEVAATLGLEPGDAILTDQTSLYNIAAIYPLRMHITGVLAPSHSPDDRAVFTDLKTTWVVQGIGHGHMDLSTTEDDSVILARKEGEVVGNAALRQYSEITSKNMGSFHFHGNPDQFPFSAMIVLPNSQKSATLLKGRYNLSETRQMMVPRQVVEELMGIVFKVKRLFDANFILVCLVTGLFISLVVLLSLRLRQTERHTLFKMGSSRLTVFWIQCTELIMVLGIGMVLAFAGSGVLLWFITNKWSLL